ncbi:MAG: PIN domain-containing protein [bacterium]|nr:PIN domain-containing protein [bacterium]
MPLPPDEEHLCIAVLDTSVLFDPYVRHMLLNLADDERYEVRWSNGILDELGRALSSRVSDDKLQRSFQEMAARFPDALVGGRHPSPATPLLPDPDDRHVLSAALACGATHIVTNNLKDFPEKTLDLLGIEAASADTFLTWMYRENPTETLRVMKKQCLAYSKPPVRTLDEFADILEGRRLDTFIRALRGHGTSWRVSPSFR